MTAARNLQLFPQEDQQQPKSQRREKGTYSLTDNAVVAYQKTHGSADTRVLMALSERANFKRKAPMTVAELQVETGLGERAVQKALKLLAAAGFCHAEGKTWHYGKAPNARANRNANENANERSGFWQKNFGLHGFSYSLKEVEGSRRNKDNNNKHLWGVFPAQGVVGGASPEKENSGGQDQVTASDCTTEGAMDASPFQEKHIHPNGERLNVTNSEKVPPAADPAQAAHAALEAAGLGDVWADWFASMPALSRNRVALNAQMTQFAEWVADGLADDLMEHTLDIVSAGTFTHPFNALKARMERAKAVKAAAVQNAAELHRAYGDPQCQPGERRRDIDGRVWTVETVEYGQVIFEEVGAPQGQPDRVVALWAVVR